MNCGVIVDSLKASSSKAIPGIWRVTSNSLNNKLVENGKLLAVCCPAREMVTVLVRDGEEDRTVLKMWKNTSKLLRDFENINHLELIIH